MPRGNGTGPMGFGPMTGRAAGYCAGYPVPGYMNPVGGRGFGFGRGFGRGWGRGYGRGGGFGAAPYYGAAPSAAPYYGAAPSAAPYYGAAPSAAQESDMLRQEVQNLEGVLGEMKERLAELEKAKATETSEG